MAGKRGTLLSEQDKKTLRDFLSCRVPGKYYELDTRGNVNVDFNYNYQEVYDYADALLHGQEISLRRNFLGLRAVSVNEEFKKILDVIGRRDMALAELCDKMSAALTVIARYGRD